MLVIQKILYIFAIPKDCNLFREELLLEWFNPVPVLQLEEQGFFVFLSPSHKALTTLSLPGDWIRQIVISLTLIFDTLLVRIT